MDVNRSFCDSGIVEDKSDKCLEWSDKSLVSSGEFSNSDKCSEFGNSSYRNTSPDLSDKSCDSNEKSVVFFPPSWAHHLWSTKIPLASWRLAELAFLSTKIPIAKWRLREYYMEKKNKVYRGTATSFGFKKPNITSNSSIKSNPQSNNSAAPLEQITNSVETLVIPPPARNGTPRLARPTKDSNGSNSRANRFGFRTSTVLSNKVADLQNNTKTNLRGAPEEPIVTKQAQGARSHLPRLQQFPVRLVAPAHYHPRTASADKNAKTAANNHTARRSRSENGGSSASSVNDADSGVGSQKSGGELEMIEQLECSPSSRNRLRQKSRPMEMILSTGHEKKFELRDLCDSIEVTEIMPLELPPLPLNKRSIGSMRELPKAYIQQPSRDSSEDDEGIEDEPGEEKVHRDRVLSEKDEKGVVGAGEDTAEVDDLWGHGEAMVGEEDMSGGQDSDSDPDSEGSPGSPDTPTHTSNSLSLSSDIRDRDFIDDEICDQPGLVYDNVTANSSGNTLVPDEPSPKCVKPLNSAVVNLTLDCSSARHSSVGTLSPCESIASDDLIMDFDLSAVDDDHRLDTSSLDLGLTDAEGDEEREKALQELSSLIAARPELMNGVRATRQLRPRVGSSGSGADSPRSLDTPRLRSGSALSSPLRSSRQGTSSPGEDFSEDSGIRMPRGTYQSIYQDVINIKALLRTLTRNVQENYGDNPHETSQKNGFYNSSCDSTSEKTCENQQEMIADLQRQVVFLLSQVEEKDRTIRSLQMTQQPTEPRYGVETCNAATQTERMRPLSTGPILSTQPDSAGGSLVSSLSDSVKPQPVPNTRPASRLPQWRRAPSPSLNELHKPLPLIGRRQT